jgi:hypothetical protein
MHRFAQELQAVTMNRATPSQRAALPSHRLTLNCSEMPNMIDVQEIQRRIIELDVEHRDLDAVIEMLTRDGHADQLQLRRLKKRKLQLKDHITLLKMQLVPDVPA